MIPQRNLSLIANALKAANGRRIPEALQPAISVFWVNVFGSPLNRIDANFLEVLFLK